jgi:ferrochelatase
MKPAVLLMAYGAPENLDEIEAFLLHVRGGRVSSPEFIEEIKKRYRLIGGGSPLLEITRSQAQALESQLNIEYKSENSSSFRVYVGMRHWKPTIKEAIKKIGVDGYSDVVALCMVPYYSRMTVGAYFVALEEAQESLKKEDVLQARLNILPIDSWHLHPDYIQAIVEKTKEGLKQFSDVEQEQISIVFTAHSLPASIVAQSDPYCSQLEETAGLVAKELGLERERWQLCFQSMGAAPVEWLGPQLKDVIEQKSREHCSHLLIVPIGFLVDNVEILYDIDIDARQYASERGIHLERTRSLNTSSLLIRALTEIVKQKTESMC